ncbi:hypothetical protein SK128_019124 [Halocaridina rubra]|uniref:Uncharacterized protein n=1 Tax=Halocaridina rubra TaxID=373956 RepID=A0AAN8WTM8_HALRR
MKTRSTILLLWLMVTIIKPGSCLPEEYVEEEVEELPQAEAYRQPMRPSFNRGGVGGGGLGGGGGFSDATYDLSKTYDAMMNKNTATDNRMGSEYNQNSKYSASKMDMGYSDGDTDSRNDYYDPYASPSEYGGYASESGYGLSCASGYVNASAVALLAFLFLLNIVQDVVQQITGGRKKREENDNSDVFSFVSNGGLSALKEGLPQVVLPLMVELLDASESPHCFQRPLCESNFQLTNQYGVVGKVVASLLSNVVSKAFTGDDTKKFHLALEASSVGRSSGNCSKKYPSCHSISKQQAHQKEEYSIEPDTSQMSEHYQDDHDSLSMNWNHLD